MKEIPVKKKNKEEKNFKKNEKTCEERIKKQI